MARRNPFRKDMKKRLTRHARLAIPVLALALGASARQARCDTVFIDTAPMDPSAQGQAPDPTRAAPTAEGNAPAPSSGPVEVFPRSRFGQSPMPLDGGVDEDFVRDEVREMDESEDEGHLDSGRGSRSPSSLRSGASGAPATAPGADGFSSMEKPARRAISLPGEPVPEAGASLATQIARRGVQEVSIIAGDLGFFPRTIFVSRDVPVRLFVTGASKGTLCFMMDSFQIRRQIRASSIEEITFTPGTPGRYRFYCPVNGMEGSMIVKELSTDSELRGAAEASVPVSTPVQQAAR